MTFEQHHRNEQYSGTILTIDCRTSPKEGCSGRARIKIQYGPPQKKEQPCGYELISFDLPDSYIGRHVTVINLISCKAPDDPIVRTQEIIFNEGLERILITNS